MHSQSNSVGESHAQWWADELGACTVQSGKSTNSQTQSLYSNLQSQLSSGCLAAGFTGAASFSAPFQRPPQQLFSDSSVPLQLAYSSDQSRISWPAHSRSPASGTSGIIAVPKLPNGSTSPTTAQFTLSNPLPQANQVSRRLRASKGK